MIIDRPTPATQNGLENVIRGWPKWMFCKAFKKHKLCSSWRVQKAYLVGIAKSFADFCTCFSLVITPHNMSVSILFVCTATHVPWRRVQKAYLVGIAKSFADFCTCFSLVITPHNMSVSILFVCTATHVPWRRVQKAYLVGIAKSFADFCTCFSLVITPHNMSVSILFVCTATHVPWRRVQKAYLVGIAKSFADFCTCFSLVITPHNMSVSILFVCTATHVPWRTGRTKVALLSFPQWTWLVSSSAHPFPGRILAWSFAVPRSHFHPPKALKSYIFKRGW